VATRRSRPARHEVQLTSIAAEEVFCRTRSRRDTDPTEQSVTVRNATLGEKSEDGLRVSCRLRTTMRIPLGETETWEGRIVLLGHFSSTRELEDIDAEFFARASALYVMWPFARSAFDQLRLLAGLQAIPLPLLVRPRIFPVRSPDVGKGQSST
jgi:hypothetical protein